MDKYRITPHKITLCILTEYYLNGRIHYHQKQSLSHLLINNIKKIDDNIDEISLSTFINTELQNILSSHFLNNEFLEMLSFESVDDLFSFITSLKDLFHSSSSNENNGNNTQQQQQQQHLLDPRSILGMFVKKIILNFSQILFPGLGKLYDQMAFYVNQFYRDTGRLRDEYDDDEDEEYEEDEEEEEEEEEQEEIVPNKVGFLSPLDEERFVYEQVIRLESRVNKEHPERIGQEIKNLKKLLPNVNRVHYIAFLNHLAHHDYEYSLEELHRYFDYSNSHSLNNDKTNAMLPYAVLNLAQLDYHYGHYENSFLALCEAIRIAQERSDHSCLAIAENWLGKFLQPSIVKSMQLSSGGSRNDNGFLVSQNHSEILTKSITRAHNVEMPDLLALNLNNLSSQRIFNSNNNNNNNNSSNNTIWTDIFQPLQDSSLLVTSQINSNMVNSISTTAWELLGNVDLSSYFTELVLKSSFNSNNELSLQNPISLGTSIGGKQSQASTLSDVTSLCRMALLKAKKDDFKGAISTLLTCHNIFKYHRLVNTTVSFTTLLVLYDCCSMEIINSSNWLIDLVLSSNNNNNNNNNRSKDYLLEIIIEQMVSLTDKFQPDDDGQGCGWLFIINVYEKISRYYIFEKQCFEKAYRFTTKAIQIAKTYGYHYYIAHFHSLLAKVFQQVSPPYSFVGLSNTLSSVSLSQQYNNHWLISESNLDLIQIHLDANQFDKASLLIQDTETFVLNNFKHCCTFYLLKSKLLIKSNSNNSKEIIKYLDQAEMYASKLEITLTNLYYKEIFYLKSCLYNSINDTEKRNEYALKFKLIINT
ncbi:hypothetical protein CYY_000751 [Polysphondylium violaceum]|uniref:Anaphase-promoting complex subunit 5 n=1 Tax=Polysphondylium violaceum TaxID=133409 RepID=A0A8J4QAC8_9MYCE|nr:hypothetical protein CYY_000751 [Polysphondylium violaceum]